VAESAGGTPPRKRTPYWLRLDELPLSLQQEIAAYLDRLAQPDPFLGKSARALRPETLLQNRHYLVLLASALVHSGIPVEQLTSIAVLVQPDNVERALRFLYERAGRRMIVQIELLAWRARKFATDAGVPDEDVARLRELYARVVRAGPSRRGMTDKNRRLLDHLDDPAFVHRLVTLPFRLMAAARQMTASTPAASSARDAVAIEILLSCSMRVGNLIELRLGETIRKFGEGPRARWAIDIPGEKVKNGQPLRYSLLPESARLLEEYLQNRHAHWCGPGSPWLFPAAQGGHVDRRYLSESIATRAYRYVGVRITAHQFRHLAAELYLRTDPGGIAIVAQHLGHRDLNTTRHFYAREQSRIATERYHDVLIRKRAAVPTRRRRTRKGVEGGV
jgi:integrase